MCMRILRGGFTEGKQKTTVNIANANTTHAATTDHGNASRADREANFSRARGAERGQVPCGSARRDIEKT